MKNSILLIRHAQSGNNALPESQRVPDPGLTELGKQQARRLADGIKRFRVSQLYCSPFRRSLETTFPISEALNLTPVVHSDIYEQGGCYSGYVPGQLRGEPGMNRAELQGNYPGWEICETIGVLGWNHGREYESERHAKHRAERVANRLTNRWVPEFPGEMAALVIHADFKRILMIALLGTDRWPDHWQPIYNTAISHLQRVDDQWRLVEWNSAEHLTPELLSD
jgi:2,3-bisphosphoglycerate-dependent phosphoglycerate mutase